MAAGLLAEGADARAADCGVRHVDVVYCIMLCCIGVVSDDKRACLLNVISPLRKSRSMISPLAFLPDLRAANRSVQTPLLDMPEKARQPTTIILGTVLFFRLFLAIHYH